MTTLIHSPLTQMFFFDTAQLTVLPPVVSVVVSRSSRFHCLPPSTRVPRARREGTDPASRGKCGRPHRAADGSASAAGVWR